MSEEAKDDTSLGVEKLSMKPERTNEIVKSEIDKHLFINIY